MPVLGTINQSEVADNQILPIFFPSICTEFAPTNFR